MRVPLVSIIIPTYKRPQMFQEALESAATQTYGNIEIIVSDDSSDTITEDLVRKWGASQPCEKLAYQRNVPALGAAENFAKSVERANGKYVNLLMDDDRLSPAMVTRMAALMETDTSINFVTSCRAWIDEKGDRGGLLPGLEMAVACDAILDGVEIGNLCLSRCTNLIGEPSTVLFRRSALTEAFGHIAGRRYGCNVDMATWLSLASTARIGFLRDVLSETRMHASQQSQTLEMRIRGVTDWLHQVRIGPTFGFLADPNTQAAAIRTATANAETVIREATAQGVAGSEPPGLTRQLLGELVRELDLLYEVRPGGIASRFTIA